MAQKKTAAKAPAKKQTSKKTGTAKKKTAAKNTKTKTKENNNAESTAAAETTEKPQKIKVKKQLSPAALEAACIITAGFAALLIFSIFFASDTIFGRIVLDVLKGFFGTGAYILPFAVILAAAGLFIMEDKSTSKYKIILSCMQFCVAVSLLHILLYETEDAFTVDSIFGGFTDSDYIGGGLIGGFFGGGSLVIFKKAGSVIIFITLAAASIVLISGKSVFKIFSGTANFVTETLMGGMYTEKRERRNHHYDNDDYDEYDGYDDYYDDYGGYDEYEVYEEPKPEPKPQPVKRNSSRRKPQAPVISAPEENVDYYEKLRKEKSYKDAKFINLKENKDRGERKARPDIMSDRITKGAYTGEDLSKYKLPPVEKEASAMPEFLKKEREKPSHSIQVSDYVPEFLRKKENTEPEVYTDGSSYKEYDNSNEFYKEEETEKPERVVFSRSEETRNSEKAVFNRGKPKTPGYTLSKETKKPNIIINDKPSDIITLEFLGEDEPREDNSEKSDYTESVSDNFEPEEKTSSSYEEKERDSLQSEESSEEDFSKHEEPEDFSEEEKEEKPSANRSFKESSRDIPPWGTPEESYSRNSSVKVIEGDAATVSKIQTKKAGYKYPKLSFLKTNPDLSKPGNKEELIRNSHILEDTLRSFRVEATVVEVSQGPTVTRYELVPAVGTKVKSIANLDKDLAMRLAAKNIMIEAPIPGKTAVGIEIPNENPSVVYFSEVVASKKFQASKSKLTFGLGKDVAGNVIVRDIAKAPHFLIAGATNSGKSVCINTLINCILYKATPDEVRLIMVDPKMVELNVYNGIPHLLIPVVTDPHKASAALNWACTEMMRRYQICADVGVRNLDEYNEYLKKEGEKPLYKIVIIIDELADLMLVAKKEVEGHIQRLTQLARAAGIHLIVATQRPSSDVITGVIKSNIPSRIAFSVAQAINSRIILDESGAEKLIGKGDMLLKTVEMERSLRVQGALISNEEIKKIVDSVKTEEPNYDKAVMASIEKAEGDGEGIGGGHTGSRGSDELINDVIAYVVKNKKASTSLIQRQFQIGYNRAARIIDELEDRGIIGPENGSKPRAVFMDKEEWREYSQRQRDYI
ncbi:MAG: DNA translocase FtsK [Clostridiales bacterium]|nr:DNA translocase FtsK [Clostridiales bacterium]